MRALVLLFGLLLCPISAFAGELRLAVTTSFNNSGLSDVLLPAIKKEVGLDVRLLAVGTGQALKLGRSGDVDAILVHSRDAEEQFVAEGYGTHRREIMYNDFVFVGPETDPAKVRNASDASDALTRISISQSVFVSRGDDSGTHRKELSLWSRTGLKPETFAPNWYREAGAGMGAALNTASGMDAYILSDRASWLKFANKAALVLLFSGDPGLFNQYAYLPVDPARHPHVAYGDALMLERWLVSPRGQKLIAEYRVNGEALFVPNAKQKP